MPDDGAVVKVEGLDALGQAMRMLPENLRKTGMRAALRAGGNVVRDAMADSAPRDSGFLAEHFDVKVSIKGQDGAAYIGPGKADYPLDRGGYAYRIRKATGRAFKAGRVAVATVARYLEFGTSRMSKRPFMTQAFESSQDRALEAITDGLRQAVLTEQLKSAGEPTLPAE